MLKHGKAFIENRADRAMPEDADYAAHNSSLSDWRRSCIEARHELRRGMKEAEADVDLQCIEISIRRRGFGGADLA
jgi:hypothetical protein